MKSKDLTDKELREIDAYLQDEFKSVIYGEIKNTDYSEHFEPIPFLRLFEEQVKFVKKNKTKPSFVMKTLKKLDLSDEQKEILLDYIRVYFNDEVENDSDIRIICRMIDELGDDKEIQEKDKVKFDFDKVLKQIDSLPTYKEKIAYLIEEKTKYKQDTGWDVDNPSFAEKCGLEITKLEELFRLETVTKQKIVEIAKHKELTVDRAIFLFNRLIPSFLECDNTSKAKFISFLTGYDYETIRQRFSSIHRKDADSPQAFKKDMEIVCKYIDILGFSEITNQIKKDMN